MPRSTGTLVLEQPSSFEGTIAGITGAGDTIDVAGYNAHTAATTGAGSYDAATNTTTLTVADSAHTTLDFALEGNLSGSGWTFTPDGTGGVDISDPPATTVVSSATANSASGTIAFVDTDANAQSASFTPEGSNYVGYFSLDPVTKSGAVSSLGFEFDLGNDQINLASGQTVTQSYEVGVTDAHNSAGNESQTVSVTIGAPGNDNFAFQPGGGADTIVNFHPHQDTIELDNFANIQNVRQLASLITTDAHGDPVIGLGHNDSITLPGVSANYLQAHLHSLVHLI